MERVIEWLAAGEVLMPRPWLAVGAGVLGALVGSFLGAVLVRLPRGGSVVAGRSRCDGCGRALGPAELVPVASFVALRGRCRQCGAAIDRGQFAAEVGGALVGVASALLATTWLHLAGGLLLGWQLLLLGLLDLRHFWLPRGLVMLLAACGLAFGWLRLGPVAALTGGALGFAILWSAAALYRRVRGREGMGAADPGLLGAIGLAVGPVGVVATLLGGSLAALAGAAAMLLTGRRVEAQTALPLGSALALAGWAVWLLQGAGG